MKIRVLDMLVCIEDGYQPMKLHIFQDRTYKDVTLPKANEDTKVVCQYYCGKKELKLAEKNEKGLQIITENIGKISYSTDCLECFKTEISAGILVCPKCNTYYPIIQDIAIIKKPELRIEEDEKDFTERWADKIKELLTSKK